MRKILLWSNDQEMNYNEMKWNYIRIVSEKLLVKWASGLRDHFVYAPYQWETTLQYNIVSHWLGPYTKWSLGLIV